jgi:hypothetical protein
MPTAARRRIRLRKFATESADFRHARIVRCCGIVTGSTMISGTRTSLAMPRGALAAAAVALLLACNLSAAAQSSNPPTREAAPAQQPGMLDSIGRWFKQSFGYVSSNVEGARDAVSGMGERSVGAAKDAANAATGAAKNAADAASGAAKDAAGAVARLPGARMAQGRELCDVAPNGAPDCRHAAEAICRAQGFASGSSLNIQSAKECPMEVVISRRERKGTCPVNSYVTRAMCQ